MTDRGAATADGFAAGITAGVPIDERMRSLTAAGGSTGLTDHASASTTGRRARASAAHSSHTARCARTSACSAGARAPSTYAPSWLRSSSWSELVMTTLGPPIAGSAVHDNDYVPRP